MFLKTSFPTLCMALCLAMSGCGDRSASPESVKSVAATPGKAAKTGLDTDLVKAASPSKAGADIDMKFKLAAHPQAGKPVGLTLVFVPPAEDVDRMTVSLQSSDGLSIESGDGPAIFVPSHGAPISHEMSVRADHDGIYFVTAAVLLEAPNSTTSSRSFSVPVIVGQGIPPTAQSTEVGASAAPAAQPAAVASTRARKAQ